MFALNSGLALVHFRANFFRFRMVEFVLEFPSVRLLVVNLAEAAEDVGPNIGRQLYHFHDDFIRRTARLAIRVTFVLARGDDITWKRKK